MDRWVGKIAVVTGASSGIGAAIAVDLVKAGMIVVGLARRKDRIEELRERIPEKALGKLYAVQCDISCDLEVSRTFAWIFAEIGVVEVLVNNAGFYEPVTITDEGNEEYLKNVLQTNLWGTIYCTKKAVEVMRRQQVIGGHIININSTSGHVVPQALCSKPVQNLYPVAKFGMTALTEVLRQEFRFDEKSYKVTVCNFEFKLVIIKMLCLFYLNYRASVRVR